MPKTERGEDPKTFYRILRRWIGALAFLLPVTLLVFGMLTTLQPTISHYYYTGMQDVFVGTLVVVGVFFLAYQGYKTKPGDRYPWLSDRVVSKVAGVSVLGVALVPTGGDRTPWMHEFLTRLNPWLGAHATWIHYGSAIVFFACTAVFCLLLFSRDPEWNAEKATFLRCGWLIVGWLVLIPVVQFSGGVLTDWKDRYALVFFLESLCAITFAFAWFRKGRGIDATKDRMRELRTEIATLPARLGNRR